MNYIGKRVTVTFPHYDKVQRTLREDENGLFVKYHNQRCSVRPDTTALGDVVPGYYIGKHPKIKA